MKKISIIMFFVALFYGEVYANNNSLNIKKTTSFKEYVCQTSETYNKKGKLTSKTTIYCDDASNRVTRSRTVYY
jgi:hypothetical protein